MTAQEKNTVASWRRRPVVSRIGCDSGDGDDDGDDGDDHGDYHDCDDDDDDEKHHNNASHWI